MRITCKIELARSEQKAICGVHFPPGECQTYVLDGVPVAWLQVRSENSAGSREMPAASSRNFLLYSSLRATSRAWNQRRRNLDVKRRFSSSMHLFLLHVNQEEELSCAALACEASFRPSQQHTVAFVYHFEQ